jgi:outer membrane lipoprotein LolB
MFRHLFLVLFCIASFAACSTAPRQGSDSLAAKQAYQSRFDHLQQLNNWTLTGRLAIADGKDGGSGRLIWAQNGSESQLKFRGAMGKGAWQLHADKSGARIELANGEVHTAASVNQLVMNQVGWKVPVDALSWWIKGLAQPEEWTQRELDENGLLAHLQQFGWDVEFSKYKQHDGFWLPTRLTARRDEYSVKMLVKQWEFEKGEDKLE